MRHSRLPAALIAAVAVALTAASTASADLITFTGGSCTTGPTTFPASLSIHPARAFTPLFVTNTATGSSPPGVLIPKTIVLNGETIVTTAPGLDESALSDSLTTCTFQTSRGTFEVTGILAPTIP